MATKPRTPRKLPSSGSGLVLAKDNYDQLVADMRLLADSEVLVGFPEESNDRDDKSPLGNAARGYIHDNGAPEQNIPARPFMVPGIEDARSDITKQLATTAFSVLKNSQKSEPSKDIVEKGLHRVGMVAEASIKNKIDSGVPPPLTDATLQARARRVPSRKAERLELANRAAGQAPSTDLVKPLIDTGEMRNSVKYVLRSKKDRS